MDTQADARARAVVLEVCRGRAVVLTRGAFRRVRAGPGWRVGDEVWVAAEAGGGRRAAGVVAALVLAGALVATGGAVVARAPAALVSLDVNPSVQMVVNRAGRVVSVAPVDPAGVRVLARVGPLRRVALSQAVVELVQAAAALGYLSRPPAAAAVAARTVPHGAVVAALPPTPRPATMPPSLALAAGQALGRLPAAPAAPVPRDGGEAVLIAAAPLAGRSMTLPPAVARQVSLAVQEVRMVLAEEGIRAAVALGRGGGADVRAARRESVSLGEYLLAQELDSLGVHVSAEAVREEPLPALLALAGQDG
jgi:hypothetical protein